MRFHRFIFLLFILLFTLGLKSQEEKESFQRDEKDYKNKEQFNKFLKRRRAVESWRINKLKTGALVVRLKTNFRQIKALKEAGRNDEAELKTLETYIVNKNTMYAYLHRLTFCKVYFILSSASDSLLQGYRSGIFLDTTLRVDPKIEMIEDYYLIAERDILYNSSLGYMPEDSAKKAIEQGNPSYENSIIVKNKYGHQLHRPFPYYQNNALIKSQRLIVFTFGLYGAVLVSETDEKGYKIYDKSKPGEKIRYRTISLLKEFSLTTLENTVDAFNDELKYFYQGNPAPDLNRLDKETLQFLY